MKRGSMPSCSHQADSLVRLAGATLSRTASHCRCGLPLQAILAKSPFKTWPYALDGGLDNPQLDQETAVIVGHCQRINPPLIAGAEPALEVHAPLVVGCDRRRAGAPLVERSPPPLHRSDQPCALEDVADRRSRWPVGLRHLPREHRQYLARSHIWKRAPRRNHLLDNRTVRGLPALQRRVRTVPKPSQIAGLPPLTPFVKRIPANPIAPANLRYGIPSRTPTTSELVLPSDRSL